MPEVHGRSKPYLVQPGESVFSLAKKHYGNDNLWTIIADANPHIKYPLDLAAGDAITIPNRVNVRLRGG